MNVVDRVKQIEKSLDDIIYTRDCPEDVLDDMRYLIRAFSSLREMLSRVTADNVKSHIDLELNTAVEPQNPKSKGANSND